MIVWPKVKNNVYSIHVFHINVNDLYLSNFLWDYSILYWTHKVKLILFIEKHVFGFGGYYSKN